MRKSVLAVHDAPPAQGPRARPREYATGLVDGFRTRRVDFVESFSFPFPGFAAFSLLGFPDRGHRDRLKEWSRNRVLLTYGRLPEDEQVATAKDVVQSMWRYVEDFVAERWADPVDDLTSDLARLSQEKPDQLNQFDIVNIVYSMALAGHETTCNTIGNGDQALLQHRDQWQAPDRRPVADPQRGGGDPPLRRARCSTTAGWPRSTPRSAACRSRRAAG